MASALAKQLEHHVRVLSEQIGSRNATELGKLAQTKTYLLNELRSYGYKPVVFPYEVDRNTYANIEVELTGETSDIILAGAHYDSHLGSPGADDNASGVAALLELAKKLRAMGKRAKTYKFVFFANEERPYCRTDFMGSLVYARKAAAEKQPLKKVIILEMLGFYTSKKGSQRYPFPLNFIYPNTGDFIAVISNFANRSLVLETSRLLSASFPTRKLIAPSWIKDSDRSDHRSFWKVGIPALMITDTADFRNDNYHLTTDTWDTLNYDKFAQLVESIGDMLLRL